MAEDTLTLATLLHDPLVQLVMRSDNVSEKDYAALLFKVKGTLELRDGLIGPAEGRDLEMVH